MRGSVGTLVALALLLYALTGAVSAHGELRAARAQTAELEAQGRDLLAENRRLRALLENADEPDRLRALAWERLGLVAPDERIFYFCSELH